MTAPSVEESGSWMSTVSGRHTDSTFHGTLSDSDAGPDFGAIPRDKSGARAAVVLSLYESDLTNRPSIQCLDWIALEIGLSSKLRRFAASLVEAADRDRAEIDRRLGRFSRRWSIAEISPVVRNILRTAVIEFDVYPETSVAVVVSEAVKLSNLFDTEKSGGFVNGVLGAVVRDADANRNQMSGE